MHTPREKTWYISSIMRDLHLAAQLYCAVSRQPILRACRMATRKAGGVPPVTGAFWGRRISSLRGTTSAGKRRGRPVPSDLAWHMVFPGLVCSEANKTALPNLSGAIPEPTSSPCGEPPLFRRIQRGSAAPRESRPADTRHPAGHVLVAWSAPDTDLVNSTYDARSRDVNYHGGREPPLLLHPPALRPLRTAPRLHAHARTHAHTHALARAHTHTHVVA